MRLYMCPFKREIEIGADYPIASIPLCHTLFSRSWYLFLPCTTKYDILGSPCTTRSYSRLTDTLYGRLTIATSAPTAQRALAQRDSTFLVRTETQLKGTQGSVSAAQLTDLLT